MSLVLGQAFFSPEGSDVGRHLWVIVSDPGRDDRVVIVNLSSQPSPGASAPRHDAASGEHPALSRPSFIRCDQARITEVAKIEEGLTRGVLSQTRVASSALIQKLQGALAASVQTKNEIKDLLRAQGFAP